MGAVAKNLAIHDIDVTDSEAYSLDIIAPQDQETWGPYSKCIPFLNTDPDFFFRHRTELTAAVICKTTCPVRKQCAAYALINDMTAGVWGGLTEKDRRALLTTDRGRAYVYALKRKYKKTKNSDQEPYSKPPKLQVVQ